MHNSFAIPLSMIASITMFGCQSLPSKIVGTWLEEPVGGTTNPRVPDGMIVTFTPDRHARFTSYNYQAARTNTADIQEMPYELLHDTRDGIDYIGLNHALVMVLQGDRLFVQGMGQGTYFHRVNETVPSTQPTENSGKQ